GRVEADLIRPQLRERLDDARRAAAGVLVLVQAQAVVEFGRFLVVAHRKRTSIDAACASSPSARASGGMVGARRGSPGRATSWTAMTRTKSAAPSPPRTRAAPAVGRT